VEEGVIRCRLDLLLTIEDATTGKSIMDRGIRFRIGDDFVNAHSRGEGNYIFLNIGRENRLMRIDVPGYEPQKLEVNYEMLDPVMPALDVFLIPSENTGAGEPVLSLKGKLSGLETVEAVHPGRGVSVIREYDPKKRIMTLLQGGRRVGSLTNNRYGIYNAELKEFEKLDIAEVISEKKIRLKTTLEREYPANSPICRIICGQVDREDGSYILRVRDDGSDLKYLVRYTAGGKTGYRFIDFHDLSEAKLDEVT
jgi:hypothetical protein